MCCSESTPPASCLLWGLVGPRQVQTARRKTEIPEAASSREAMHCGPGSSKWLQSTEARTHVLKTAYQRGTKYPGGAQNHTDCYMSGMPSLAFLPLEIHISTAPHSRTCPFPCKPPGLKGLLLDAPTAPSRAESGTYRGSEQVKKNTWAASHAALCRMRALPCNPVAM